MEIRGAVTQKGTEPEWFRIGKDAVHVMERLDSLRELDFYLRHPEPFIRLHAIRRIATLLLPDAVPALARRLDDPLENEQNRDEAGWAIRRIARAKGLQWFAHTVWTDRYDGTEPVSGRYGITLRETTETAGMDAIRSNTGKMEPEDEVLLRIQMEEQPIRIDFSPLPWLVRNARWLLSSSLKGLLRLLANLARGFVHGSITGSTALMRMLSRMLSRRMARMAEQRTLRRQTATASKESMKSHTGDTALNHRGTPFLGPKAGMHAQAGSSATEMPHVEDAERMIGRLIGNESAFPTGRRIGNESASRTGRLIGNESAFPAEGFIGNESASIPSTAAPLSSLPDNGPAIRQTMCPEMVRALHPDQYEALRAKHRSTDPSHVRIRRKGGSSVFRLLFYPIRLIRQHWVFTLLVLMTFYMLLAFSHAGRQLVHTLNPQAQVLNDHMVASVRTMAAGFLGIEPVTRASAMTTDTVSPDELPLPETSISPGSSQMAPFMPKARISAPKGLNLRAEPSNSGAKIIWMPMDSQVEWLGESRTDEAGNRWQSVSFDGRTGWALEKWMTPAENGGAHAGS